MSDFNFRVAEHPVRYDLQADPQYIQVDERQPQPSNYLALSLVTIMFCCWPFGLCALIHSRKVSTRWESGDRSGAMHSSAAARGCSLAGIFISLLFVFAVVVVVIIKTADRTTRPHRV
ncbi:proline rich transmembrane protein 1B-like [Corticium candelabrum]|uniref:proline rich transmembrane protein 1B-like n=1 Tax=Corticium candelabrum TaxID=121492 RepID=UPI002E25C9F7|nr:proline rich transmembrane protein 1B-like [Corticium candelabrum]